MNKNELLSQFLELGTRGLQIQSGNYYNTTNYDSWLLELSLFCDRHLQDHPYYKTFKDVINQKEFSQIQTYFEAIRNDKGYWAQLCSQAMPYTMNTSYPTYFQPRYVNIDPPESILPNQVHKKSNQEKQKVFIVHGHDNAAKQEAARTIQTLGFDPIILHEQPDGGKTIIEKIEAYTNVVFAVVLYTECDKGRAKDEPVEQEQFRARQNVVFEHGYLIGKLNRIKVCALVKGSVETPGDITGVVYTKMDDNGAWKFQLVKNMNAAGLTVDANKLIC